MLGTAIAFIGGIIFDEIVRPAIEPIPYAIGTRAWSVMPWREPDWSTVIELRWRRKITAEEYFTFMARNGFDKDKAEKLYWNAERILTAEQALIAKRHGLITEAEYQEIMTKNHMDEKTIKQFEKVMVYFPPPADLIRFAVREVYTPEIVEKYGQMEDLPPQFIKEAAKAGIPEDVAKWYWAAHWELPSPTQGFVMRHRGLIDNDELLTLLRTLDVMPYWRDKLAKIAWDIPGRIELRMMARYGIADRDFIKDTLIKGGLDPAYADAVADMNMAIAIAADLRSRFGNGWITADEVRAEIERNIVTPVLRDRMFEWVVKAEKPERIIKERELTKSEIIKGIKRGVITVDDGKELLTRLGYEDWEAEFIIAINVTAMAGSPETGAELRELVEKYRKAQGLPYLTIPPELQVVELEMKRKRKEIEDAKAAGKTAEEISILESELASIEARYLKLLREVKPAS